MHLVILFVLIALASPEQAEPFACRVVGVADDDTLTVLDGEKRQHRRLGLCTGAVRQTGEAGWFIAV